MFHWIKRYRWLVLFFLLLLLALFIRVWVFVSSPVFANSQPFIYQLQPGSSLQQMSRELQLQGRLAHPFYFRLYARLTGQAHNIQAGIYQFNHQQTPGDVLQQLVMGDVIHDQFRLQEGWTLQQTLNALHQLPFIKHTARYDAALEGVLFPDTYQYKAGSSDQQLLQRSQQAMTQLLEQLWPTRQVNLPYFTAYQALIVASIVEKETALADERALIAGVIVNRLKNKMPLQMDPTVMYGLYGGYDRALSKEDLKHNNPYNTYLHQGLPPTPICMPSKAAILAALHPAQTEYFYFVAKGDGSHQFSTTLQQQIKAIQLYRGTP